ncbi:hypothetical protein PG991_003551 [Apiospora marii]|uniref:Rhodopsin domain-containing protein n=1 Tax=Apiospora marii TaxID=335849 RepID=A0ABR1S3P5_9PEZI
MSNPLGSRPPTTAPPLISPPGVVWVSAALPTIALAIRLISRSRGPKKLFADDWLIIFAWFLCGLSAILWQQVTPYLYTFLNVVSGNLWPPPDSFVQNAEQAYKGQLVVLVFWYTSLFMVKLSFLFFFRRLRRGVTKGQYLWWSALALTTSVYLVWIGTIQYKCLAQPLQKIMQDCPAASSVEFEVVTLKANCALDVVTDFLIRVVVISTSATGDQQFDIPWMYLWSSVELCVGMDTLIRFCGIRH